MSSSPATSERGQTYLLPQEHIFVGDLGSAPLPKEPWIPHSLRPNLPIDGRAVFPLENKKRFFRFFQAGSIAFHMSNRFNSDCLGSNDAATLIGKVWRKQNQAKTTRKTKQNRTNSWQEPLKSQSQNNSGRYIPKTLCKYHSSWKPIQWPSHGWTPGIRLAGLAEKMGYPKSPLGKEPLVLSTRTFGSTTQSIKKCKGLCNPNLHETRHNHPKWLTECFGKTKVQIFDLPHT